MARLQHFFEQPFQDEDVAKGLWQVASKWHWLCHAALESSWMSVPGFKMRPKFHRFFSELVGRTKGGNNINPRFLACNGEEDFIGKTCAMAKLAIHPTTMAL